MNQEIKELWLDGLRNGEYKQGQHALKKIGIDNECYYCCLGVLTEVVNDKLQIYEKREAGCSYVSFIDPKQPGQQYDAFPPMVVMQSCAFDDADEFEPYVDYDGDYIGISQLNDKYGLSFDDMADIIEEQL